MAKRPFISKGIDEMEQIFKSSGTELLTLRALENELVHRSTPRAVSLLKTVRRNLSLPQFIGNATDIISSIHSPTPPKWPILFLHNEQNTFLDWRSSLPKRLNPCR